MDNQNQIWRCRHGHALGQLTRTGRGVARLLVYRQAVDVADDVGEAPEVMAVVEGQVFDIRCSVCGDVRTWWDKKEKQG